MHLAHPLRSLHEERWGGLTPVRPVRLPVLEPSNCRLRPVRTIIPLHLIVPREQYFYSTFSVRLPPMRYPQDLIDKFVECIVRLPNLKTLEVLEVRARAPISKALRRKHAIFPTIRELRITPACHHFIRKCPNLKDLTFTTTMDTYAPSTLLAYGKGLRRVAGVTGGVHGELRKNY